MQGNDKVAGWKSQPSSQQIDDKLSIGDAIGLDYLYGDSLLPTFEADKASGPARLKGLYG